MEQATFNFGDETNGASSAAEEPNELAIGTLNAIVFEILAAGEWKMPFEICETILAVHHQRVSDSSITARLRDLRKDKFGGHTIELRKRAGSRAYEYRLVD